MRREIEAYFSNAQESNGLLIAEAPTGYGKTYETVHAIYQYVQKGGRSQVLFVTNLLKNLPVEELRALYEQDGKGEQFEKEVLVLASTASCVEEAILTEKIPAEFQGEAYQALYAACEKKNRYQQKDDEASREMVRYLDEQIRLKLELSFRHELEAHFQKRFPQDIEARRDAVRCKKKYQWMAKFYPAIFWNEYKILLLSVKKLMARNTPLVESSFECLSDKMLTNRIVCIDEFDASRAVVLDSLIERALELRADYLQLFLQVYRGTKNHCVSRELETIRNAYETGRTMTWDKLSQEAEKIHQDGALYYSMKTVGITADEGRNFLFHDTSYHTVLDGDRTHIRAVCNEDAAQVQIHFETREAYYAHKDEPRIVLQNLLRRIHVFLMRFQQYVYGWAELYAKHVNNQRYRVQDFYTVAAAAESIFRDFGLTSTQTRLMTGELADNKSAHFREQVIAPNLSFYETGFRLFEFIDDDHHRAQTDLQYLQMRNTPESVLLYLCKRAKVVGLSATAALPTVLGNYDLRYLKEQLGEHYHELSSDTKAMIRKELETLWQPYRDGRIQVQLQVVDGGKDHLEYSERLKEIFGQNTLANVYEKRLVSVEAYVAKRYCNLFEAIKTFWQHPDIHAFLCLNQMLPAPGKPKMDEYLLRDALEDLRSIYAPEQTGQMMVLRSGDSFEKDKESLLRVLQQGTKCFVLSSYQTIGAGQNLQYPVSDTSGLITLNTAFDQMDSRFQKKDFDALYLGEITHVVVNLNENRPLRGEELVKFCFQVECLYQNDEISYHVLHDLLRDGIGRFSGRQPTHAAAQRALRQCDSVRGRITRDVIQAVGRMNRTFLKNPSIYLLTTEKLVGSLALTCLENRVTSPEMDLLRQARIDLGRVEPVSDHAHNEAERKATRGNTYIMRMLNVDWTEESMTLWKALRQTVLCHPRAEQTLMEQDPVVRAYYIPLPAQQPCYFYAQKGDFSEVILSHNQDRAQFSASLPEGLYPSVVSEEEARLAQILAYPGMKEHFIRQGWATAFGDGAYILSPVLFQNIYKGALGEVAGKFILERELGLCLQEIEDPTQFECFDFVAEDGVYFDFKHWKGNMRVDQTAMRTKALRKLDTAGGKRALIINLFSDGVSVPSCTSDERLIEVPGLLLPNGQIDPSALEYIRRCML